MTKRKPIDVDELKKTFRINNGKLERIDLRRTDGKWKVVDNKKNHTGGYCKVGFNGRPISYHVIIWILSTGKDIPKGYELDHINGDRIDNRIENLRLVNRRGNAQNMKVHRNGQIVGSSFHKTIGKYQTNILIGKKLIYIGYYDTEEDGGKAYEIACKHIKDYKDNKSFRELVKKEMENYNGR